MDRNDIERFRDPGFTIARRGYDQHEVDKLLGSLVDWLETDAPKDLGDIAAKRKLELVGRSTARILMTADEEAAELHRLTEDECAELRATADEDARQTTAAAQAKAAEIVEEGERRRAEIEAVVAELEAQRDHTVQELERLRAELASAIGTHAATKPEAPASAS